MLIQRIGKRLESQKITLATTEKALDYIALHSYDPTFGARPIKRYLHTMVETPLAKKIIEGSLKEHDTITIDADEAGLIFTVS